MSGIRIPEGELEFSAIRASGPGGQNVNKVSTAVQLRFAIRESSLPDKQKAKLLACSDSRITGDGVVVIKAQRYRSQEQNRQDALNRLYRLIEKATAPRKPRIATRPGRAAKEKRLKEKKIAGKRKSERSAVRRDDD